MIVVRSKAQREALSKAMIGFNVQRVLNAPVTVVILADKYGRFDTHNHACIHTYIHEYTHTYIYTYIHTYIYTYIHTYIYI